MTTRYPILVASKIRARLDHRLLDVGLRLRIKIKHHYKGTLMRPVHDDDAEAVAWIEAQVARWGVMSWQRTGQGGSSRYGWAKLAGNQAGAK